MSNNNKTIAIILFLGILFYYNAVFAVPKKIHGINNKADCEAVGGTWRKNACYDY